MRDLAERHEESFVDLSTAAQRLGITRITVNKLVLDRRLPARRWGQRWMVDRADLERFAETYRPDRGKAVHAPLHPEHLRNAMKVVRENPGITVAGVAERIGRARRTVLGWMQLLDREGLIERRRGWDPKDPASCFLTEAGEAFLAREKEATTP
jgi:excisionase family DNA binding protein